jgi:hypothetical protein
MKRDDRARVSCPLDCRHDRDDCFLLCVESDLLVVSREVEVLRRDLSRLHFRFPDLELTPPELKVLVVLHCLFTFTKSVAVPSRARPRSLYQHLIPCLLSHLTQDLCVAGVELEARQRLVAATACVPLAVCGAFVLQGRQLHTEWCWDPEGCSRVHIHINRSALCG